MCGLTGIVTDPRLEGASDPTPLLQQLLACADAPSALSTLLDSLEAQVAGLFSLGSVWALLSSPGAVEDASRLGRTLRSRAEACETRRAASLNTEERERLSALSIRLQDLAWRILEDLLPNLDKIVHLAGGAALSVKGATELWKLNTLLNSLDRLEVRGRDSAGFAVQVCFPDGDALAAFEGVLAATGLGDTYHQRIHRAHFVQGAILRTSPTLTFSLKVAREIGELGQNVATLRAHITSDAILAAALRHPLTVVTPVAHTRWASNGIISEPNCHPLTNECLTARGEVSATGAGVVAALNGDIDNFLELKERLRLEGGRDISPEITTDAKIIPLWIEHHLRQGGSFEDAFRKAVAEFQGSMAISVQNSAEPGRIYLALKGSGQSIYLGQTAGGFLFASELYGLVEETRRYWRMDGERPRVAGDTSTQGQMVVLDPARDGSQCQLRGAWLDGHPLTFDPKGRLAEITTRDINRAGYPHFLLKEISEAVLSARKTLQGKVASDAHGPTFPFLTDICPAQLLEDLDAGRIRRVLCIGQGTAAIAAQAVASIMERLLKGTPLQIDAMKATELSGFHLRDRMDDVLIVAVSQSGTTTDTNRTVDMVKERGAKVLAVVNRRNSDLVYKAHAVFYTSDGRDVEMSVASTKAFYAQVTAGYLLSLALADRLGALPREVLEAELAGLKALPDLIGKVVARPEGIAALAERLAVRHRHWALVGSGLNHVAAQEIRIKLSELCYKAIPVDFTEDKKHIDLSSEPLIIVCAAGLDPDLASDVAKEVAIFKAHKAFPVVICTEDETRFDTYAAGIIRVPRATPGVAFVLATVAGHLWSYHAARALDAQAQVLRRLRARCVEAVEAHLASGDGLDTLLGGLRMAASEEVRTLDGWLREGALNSGLTASTAVRLSLVLKVLGGRLTADDLYLDLGASATQSPEAVGALVLEVLTEAVDALTRPIDAIKHQAKTVTVGISRAEAPRGPLFETIRALGIGTEQLLPSHKQSLEDINPLVGSVVGAVLYQVDGLSPSGAPTTTSTLKVSEKLGISRDLKSRLEHGGPLAGSKREIVSGRRIFVGVGSYDGRSLVMFPLFTGSRPSGVALLHVRFREDATVEDKVRALRGYRRRYDQIVGHFAERSLSWDDRYLEALPAEMLFEAPVLDVAARALGTTHQ